MGKKKNYGEVIRARVSKEEKEFIYKYCKDNETDFSKLIRNFINTLKAKVGGQQ